MLGERISAPQARDWGLINQVWPDTELTARAEDIASCRRFGIAAGNHQ